MQTKQEPSVDLQLAGVPRTLLMPLWNRAKATSANSRIISDSKAVEIVGRLTVDFEALDKGMNSSSGFFQVARARVMDDIIRGFLAHNPNATIVDLGAGLDTAFWRVDNGLLRWFDVDLPQVITLRKQLISETDRSRSISASILDPDWVHEIEPRTDGVLLFASGVLIYFRKAELHELFSILSNAFPGADLVFDTQSRISVLFGNIALKKAGMESARLQWSAQTSKPILKLHRGLELIDEFTAFAKFAKDYFADERMQRTATVMDWMRTISIIHVRFKRTGK
jgi:O-methyltransferase involved in polyketide biosynthesis